MQLEAVKRLYALLHKDAPYHDGSHERWSANPSREYPFHFADGVSFWMSREDLTPDADWLGGSVAEESPGE